MRTDRTDMVKPTDAFRNLTNTPKKNLVTDPGDLKPENTTRIRHVIYMYLFELWCPQKL